MRRRRSMPATGWIQAHVTRPCKNWLPNPKVMGISQRAIHSSRSQLYYRMSHHCLDMKSTRKKLSFLTIQSCVPKLGKRSSAVKFCMGSAPFCVRSHYPELHAVRCEELLKMLEVVKGISKMVLPTDEKMQIWYRPCDGRPYDDNYTKIETKATRNHIAGSIMSECWVQPLTICSGRRGLESWCIRVDRCVVDRDRAMSVWLALSQILVVGGWCQI